MERKDEKQPTREQGEPSDVTDPRSQTSMQRYVAAAHQIKQLPSSKVEARGCPRSPTPTTMKTSISASPSPPLHDANPSLNQLQVALKFLVSNSASGLIIGRSGSTISDLQAKSQTRIKLSQGGDYYPGTSDRVCLIQGSLANASSAVDMVLAKLYDLQSSQQLASTQPTSTSSDSTKESLPEEHASTSFIVRLLVPSTCCGMIIGRGGSNIKSLKEKAEVTYIQLSPKEHGVVIGGSTVSTSERIMTITGQNFLSCVNCVKIILNDMAQNPEISRYINLTTSYSKNLVSTPSSYALATPGFFLENEPFATHVVGQPQILQSPPRYSVSDQFMAGQFVSSPPPGTGLQHHSPVRTYDCLAGDMSFPVLGDTPTMVQSQPYDQSMLPSQPRHSDTMPPSSSSFPQYRQPQPVGHAPFWSQNVPPSSPGISPSASGDLSSVDQLAQSFQGKASLQESMQRHLSHSSVQPLASAGPVSVQIGVPDNRIGSILGRGGKTLTELQGLSQTKIRISQRGEFIQGTQNRIVTITGDTKQVVEHAKQLVNQRLAASVLRSSSSSTP